MKTLLVLLLLVTAAHAETGCQAVDRLGNAWLKAIADVKATTDPAQQQMKLREAHKIIEEKMRHEEDCIREKNK